MLQTVKLTCENGYSWSTSVSANSTKESLEAYFVGNMFNTASYPSEVMSRCVKCELVPVVAFAEAFAGIVQRLTSEVVEYVNLGLSNEQALMVVKKSTCASDKVWQLVVDKVNYCPDCKGNCII